MPGEEVIELSVEETNELREKLGLAPLRTGTSDEQQEEVLELSVDATNDLRQSLGLAPLKVDGSKSSIVHKPAENEGEALEVKKRLEKARLEREVQKGISTTFGTETLGKDDDKEEALSWAEKMRTQKTSTTSKKKKKSKKETVSYGEEDLHGINVAHSVTDLGDTPTILTLADAPLLKSKDDSKKPVGLNEDEQQLENVELAEQRKQRDGLRKKRQLELGMGRAGGYAGFDDDEFEELSGTMGPSRMPRGAAGGPAEGGKTKSIGFQIGQAVSEDKKEPGSDLFAAQEGRGISLEPTQADVTASDFMTVEEDLEQTGRKKKKKDAKFKKKKKKEKKKHRRKTEAEDDQETPAPTAKGFLDELEATAVESTKPSGRKRRRSDADEDDHAKDAAPAEVDEAAKKRARFDATMEKGNIRTAEVFKVVEEPAAPKVEVDDEPDDAFLNAALAKARRLRRLKEMSSQKTETTGADAVAQSLQQSRAQLEKDEKPAEGGVTFAVDDTREFTRALRARAEQAERQQARKAQAASKKIVAQTTTAPPKETEEPKVETVVNEAPVDKHEEEDIADLAKEIKEDNATGLEGTTASTVSVGRGMANVLSMLRHTGEITGKNAGKEEMRGRAKDKRTYEDYEALDLSQVVKIGKDATDKDKEFANREIKLEYRDEHGRLLTRKEAYRNLCYQFHGHGSSAKNEERRLRQIAREQAEARVASSADGSLGALKATQKATGKAFVVHKT